VGGAGNFPKKIFRRERKWPPFLIFGKGPIWTAMKGSFMGKFSKKLKL
jgi:hypothetical protein